MAAAAAATAEEYEEMLRVVEACAARIRWRLRPQSKRRLLNDIMFLCTRLRPVVLMDYGGTMPELQENLCSLLHHARQETSILSPLRVMVIKDMLYLIHAKGLAEHASPNARSQHQLAFVDLGKSYTEENDNVHEFVSIQDLFSAKFPVDAALEIPEGTTDTDCSGSCTADRISLVIDLTASIESALALPSLNGWLLGYPVIYLFCNGSAEIATQNLSKHSLHIYRIYAVRHRPSAAKQSEQELMSFSVPIDMSTKRDEEPWAKSFLCYMNEKIKQCNHVWASIWMEIEVFQSQSGLVVL
ncbi:uncharacterized protein LOC102722423 isoform X2 [Oryza brachyantha]|uniref:uncharacterized protein LOC102722423 isoform X2 n=1 Tax=Oryza brachyantha TaxID=4533 RepID=UPI001ADD3C63|nr:uncharacterized protein LOC102722423 isoform X2 [Oryza brachyantha]